MKKFARWLGALAVLAGPALSVPVISGSFTQSGGLGLGTATGGTTTVGRPFVSVTSPNLALIEATLGLPAGTLNTLSGGPFHRAGILSQVFTGGLQGEGIQFTASSLPAVLSGSPSFAYFATLDPLFGSLPTLFVPLALTTTAQTFRIDLPADGDYRFGFGAIRTNPSGAYGTTAILSGVLGVERVPELNAGAACLPLLFVAGLMLAAERRRALAV